MRSDRTTPGLWSALAVATLLAACQSRTELMLGVATDLAAPQSLDRVRLEVSTEKDSMLVEWDISGRSNEPFNLPGSYGLLSEGDEVTVDILLTGFKNEEPIVTRRAALNLVEGQTLFYRMGLTAGCVGRDDCPPTSTCVEGVCRDAAVDPLQLPDFDPLLVTELTCNAGSTYLDTALGTPMPFSANAMACPTSLCLEGTCLKPPAIETGTRTVRGSNFTTYVQPNNRTTQVPVDLSAFDVAALVRDGKGGFTTIPGQGAADGTFVIEGVPRGGYYLKIGTSFTVTASSMIDLGSVDLGRPDHSPSSPTTSITLNVSNLSSWAVGNVLEAYAPEANAWWFYLESNVTPEPVVGATALTNFSFAATDAGSRLIQNDAFAVIQYTNKQASTGETYQAATRVFTPGPFTQIAGATSALTGAFSLVPQTETISLDVRALEWDSAVGFDGTGARLLHPEAVPINRGVYVVLAGQPGGLNYGFFSPTVDYLFVTVPPGANKILSDLSFGIPNITAHKFARVLHQDVSYRVAYTVPGATTPTYLYPGLYQIEPVQSASPTVTPALGPVGNPSISGRDLFQPQQGTGTTPEITWSPPTLGIATRYVLAFHRLSLSGQATQRTLVGTFTTNEPKVVVPPGVLEAGQLYVLMISADTSGNIDAPSRLRYPHATSTIASAIITP